MRSESFLLTPQNLPGYLASRGLAADERKIHVRELGGGVSNIVLLIEWPEEQEPGRCWVAKQSLGKLRVQDDWRSERTRVFREAHALQALRPVLGESSLPEVVYVDRENYFFIMTGAPFGSLVWKESLLQGRVDLAVAERAGGLLARLINASRADPRLREPFEDRTVFDQLRIDPYYRTTAGRHPDIRAALEELMADSWEIRTALVHGDYSPKNMLMKEGRIFLIDFEVVHWGDPAFDAAFLLNHLFLKALFQPRFAPLYLDAVREFWKTLRTDLKREPWEAFEALVLRHLGGLMLARIDGKSPVEYIREEETKERVRQVAKQILRERPKRLEEAGRLILEASV